MTETKPSRGIRVVSYDPVRCPHCQSNEVPVTSSPKPDAGQKKLRHHKCNACRFTFASIEREPPDLGGSLLDQ